MGDIVYSDKSYGRATQESVAAAAAAGKTAIGVITWISEDGTEAKAVNLKNLATNGSGDQASFDPEDPYYSAGKTQTMKWQKSAYYDAETSTYYGHKNITAIKDYYRESNPSAYAVLTAGGSVSVTNEAVDIKNMNLSTSSAQYNSVLNEYDNLIVDTSYQGINLLNDGTLNVTFDEKRNHTYVVEGFNATAEAIGISAAAWQTLQDIQTSVTQLSVAMNTIRNEVTRLGNSYQVIQTRENFTDALTDILETGADNLLLADMNEESANYLALQTRQQLAINSLSLASQSAQSVLKLF